MFRAENATDILICTIYIIKCTVKFETNQWEEQTASTAPASRASCKQVSTSNSLSVANLFSAKTTGTPKNDAFSICLRGFENPASNNPMFSFNIK